MGKVTVAPIESAAAGWYAALAAYEASKADEDAFERLHFAVVDQMAAGPTRSAAVAAIPRSVWDEIERLSDIKADAEDVLMDTPSPHASGFALKYLVAHGDGRETDAWNDMLEGEARRFAQHTDAALERLWQDRCETLAQYDADDEALEDEAVNRSYWDRIEAAEDAIVAHPSISPHAVEMRMWIALFHGAGSHITRIGGPVATAIQQGETAPLIAAYAELDFHEQAILIAILNLRGETL